MLYSKFAEIYDDIASTTKKLEKIEKLSVFLKYLSKEGKSEWIYLLRGKILPDYDSRELGISDQIISKVISSSYGIKEDDVTEKFKKIGDWGEIAYIFSEKRKQNVLFSKKLDVEKVFSNLLSILDIEGKGSIDRKVKTVSEILSFASANEAKYIIRTILSDLRIGIADAIVVDSINKAFFDTYEMKPILEEKFDLCNDLALLFESASKGKNALDKIDIEPGRPVKVMLAVKATDLEDAFRICGSPAAIEHKYDGFRMLINKNKGKISLFTRKLENVTKQFPDVVKATLDSVKGTDFILDCEVVGYDPKSKKYLPFEAVSQRIKRKYDIEEIIEKLPVEVNIFDVIYHNSKSFIESPFSERRKLIEKIISEKKLVIRPAVQIITSDMAEAEDFYRGALKIGEEGIMMKNLSAPYKQGRKVGYMIKLKPIVNDLDLVIVGAEYGTGKRAGWLTSFMIACRDGDEVLEIGMVSSGLKEKEEEGTSYEEMTKLLKPLIESEEGNIVKVKPKVVVSVTYQNIQKSPSYRSGYALRFPRITAYRSDRSVFDIASIEDIEREVKKQR